MAEGTSFAAPQVSAAAATLIASRPDLGPDQVTAILEQTAVDGEPSSGCRICPLGRDALTGWGRLDVTAALAALDGPLPAADRFEPNDDAGGQAYTLWGPRRRIEATLDFWDDQNDVYRIHLRRASGCTHRCGAGRERPDPRDLEAAHAQRRRPAQGVPAVQGFRPLRHERLHRLPSAQGGWHYLQVKLPTVAGGAYKLGIVKVGLRRAARR